MIELVVSMGIMALLIGVVVVNFRSGQQFDELRISAETLVDNLRAMQNRTMSGQTAAGDVPLGGYGAHFPFNGVSPITSYILFADSKLPPNQWYDANDIKLPNGDVAFSSNVRMIKMTIGGVPPLLNCQPCGVSLTYKPPDAHYFVVVHKGDVQDQKIVEMLLQHSKTKQCRRVTVNGISGQVSEEMDDDCAL